MAKLSKTFLKSSYLIGVLMFFAAVFITEHLTINVFLIMLILLIIYMIVMSRISDYSLKKSISSSYDPRSAYWELFLENRLNRRLLKIIPHLKTYEYEDYKTDYLFFNKDDDDEEILYISKEKIKFRIQTGKYKAFPLNEINVIKLNHEIKIREDDERIILELMITTKTGRLFRCNIRTIKCDIVELERILSYYANRKNISLILPKYMKESFIDRVLQLVHSHHN